MITKLWLNQIGIDLNLALTKGSVTTTESVAAALFGYYEKHCRNVWSITSWVEIAFKCYYTKKYF